MDVATATAAPVKATSAEIPMATLGDPNFSTNLPSPSDIFLMSSACLAKEVRPDNIFTPATRPPPTRATFFIVVSIPPRDLSSSPLFSLSVSTTLGMDVAALFMTGATLLYTLTKLSATSSVSCATSDSESPSPATKVLKAADRDPKDPSMVSAASRLKFPAYLVVRSKKYRMDNSAFSALVIWENALSMPSSSR